MVLGIDASNIRAGGGLTHLREILGNINLNETGFKKVVIWASKPTLEKMPDQPWLLKKSNRLVNISALTTLFWQLFYLKRSAEHESCNIIFAPGSTFISGFMPFVTLSQNMLPFEMEETMRFKNWITRLRFLVLNLTQSYTFRKANGVIFLTNYARNYISGRIKINQNKTTIIPHGISAIFLNRPKHQKVISSYSLENPFRFLYVSIITVYKHQWNVAKAVSELRKKGYPVELDLVGPQSNEGFSFLEKVINAEDPNNQFIHYHGSSDHEGLKNFYQKADAFVFASSCENMPIILIEAMSAGLPIACSDRGPMPEVLKENGFYFDPENVESIADALISLIENTELRFEKANKMFSDVSGYTWKDCASKTFEYLHQVALKENKGNHLTNSKEYLV